MEQLTALSQPSPAGPRPPWLADDICPPAPAAPYGYRRGKELVPCSFAELDAALRDDPSRQIGLVWTPLQPRMTPPEEVPFLAEALAEGERRRAWAHLRMGGLQILLWGFMLVFALSSRDSAPPAYLLYLLTFGLIPLAEHAWTLAQMRRSRWEVPSVAAGRFRAWLADQPSRWTSVLLGCLLVVGLVQLGAALTHLFDDERSTVLAAGLLKPAVWQGELWRLLTAPLLHGNPIHFIFNALALLVLGKLAEVLISREALALTFLLAALAGGLLSLLLLPAPSVGASGGVMGLLGLLIALGLRRRALLPPFFLRGLVVGAALTALIGLAAFAVIDNAAHLGGFLAGLALGQVLIAPGQTLPAGARMRLREVGWAALACVVSFSLVAVLAIVRLLPLSGSW